MTTPRTLPLAVPLYFIEADRGFGREVVALARSGAEANRAASHWPGATIHRSSDGQRVLLVEPAPGYFKP
jgi:hypothetical protein